MRRSWALPHNASMWKGKGRTSIGSRFLGTTPYVRVRETFTNFVKKTDGQNAQPSKWKTGAK
eukprot:898171-Amphidinium_carterae.1